MVVVAPGELPGPGRPPAPPPAGPGVGSALGRGVGSLQVSGGGAQGVGLGELPSAAASDEPGAKFSHPMAPMPAAKAHTPRRSLRNASRIPHVGLAN